MKTKLDEFLNETYDPWSNITYNITVSVRFRGIKSATLVYQMVIGKDDVITDEMVKNYIDNRLKEFGDKIWEHNVVSYEIASKKDHIYPVNNPLI